MAGCAQRVYGPPPPPAFAPHAIYADADHNGFRAGAEDGARDAASGTGFIPGRTAASLKLAATILRSAPSTRTEKHSATPTYAGMLTASAGARVLWRNYFPIAYKDMYNLL